MIRPPLQRSLIAFVLIFAAGFLGYRVPSMGGRLPLMLLPSGLAVACLCRWGLGQWPALPSISPHIRRLSSRWGWAWVSRLVRR
ncbi:MAG: hypothetical protein ABSD02_14820 [Steroidobacteraceae bacterium]|jgi:hypothetical protein